jgi:hypothetical protein
MQKKYCRSWYQTATFVQKTTEYDKDGNKKVSTWYEALSVPGSLRIDFTPIKDGNGILFTDNRIYSFKDGKQESSRPFVHPLMILGFDIYKLPPEKVLEILKALKFDLTVLREDNWEGRPVYVVGAKQGGVHSPQFWIDQKNLYFVRCCDLPGKTERKRRRRSLTSTSDWVAGGWRRRLFSKSTIKFAPPKSILRCAPMFHSTPGSLTRNTGQAFHWKE